MEEYFVEEKTTWDRVMDVLVFLAVFVVTIFLILELFGYSGKAEVDVGTLNSIYLYVNLSVLIVFALDLFRLWKKSSGAKDFFSKNWLDVLATIPFELLALALALANPTTVAAFGLLKWLRVGQLAKVSRVSKITKQFKAASHLKKEGEDYKKKHRL